MFKVGDKVFAKVKGYPAWPAKVVSVVGNKYNVEFYGTQETGLIKEEHVSYYLRNKERLSTHIRRRLFHDAVAEIEEAILEEGGDGETRLGEPGCPTIVDKRRTATSRNSAGGSGGSRGNGQSAGTGGGKRKRSGSNVPQSKRAATSGRADGEEAGSCDEGDDNDDTIKLEPETEGDNVEDDDFDICRNVQFTPISEKYLNNCIAYAKYVMESAPSFKGKPMEPRDDQLEPILPVKLPTGTVAGLRMYRKWPLPDFSNELERALYDETAARRTLEHKRAFDSPDGAQKVRKLGAFVKDLGVNMDEVKHELWKREQADRRRRRDRLVVETSLAHHEIQIKRCLRLDGAEPAEALVHLISIESMRLDSLTLRKYPRIVSMVRRLKKYDGNVAEWQLTGEKRDEFHRNAAKLRAKAVELYHKFRDELDLPDNGMGFYANFLESMMSFQRLCQDLTDKQKVALCAEPKSRQAFMDNANETDLEKENSSNVANSEQQQEQPAAQQAAW